MLNYSHQYLIADMNGFPRATATTRPCALKRARALAADTGLDMQVCFNTRYGARIINVRCRDFRKLARRHYALNGQAFLSGGVA